MRNRKRYFVRRKGRRIKRRVTFLIAILGGLTACAPATEYWSPVESPKVNEVEWVEFHHRVTFEHGAEVLSENEIGRLGRFLHRFAGELPPSARVVVVEAAANDTSLSARRMETVVARLREAGLPAIALRPGDSALPAPAEGILVTIGRHVVTPPRCPDWSKPSHGDPGNRRASNFGCATVTNLGLMVADPATLLRGQPPGPADGEALASGIDLYRRGGTSDSSDGSSQGAPQGITEIGR